MRGPVKATGGEMEDINWKALQDVTEQFIDTLGKALGEALNPDRIAAVTQAFDGFTLAAYEQAGSPYGPPAEDRANVHRWLVEVNRQTQAEAEAECQREREQMMLDLSAQLQAKRVN
jgi:hypothetical protein